jgi:hypothetical protein
MKGPKELMKHSIFVRDWKEEFPIQEALAAHQKWGKLYVVEAKTENDAVAWVFSDQMVNEQAATEIYDKEFRADE